MLRECCAARPSVSCSLRRSLERSQFSIVGECPAVPTFGNGGGGGLAAAGGSYFVACVGLCIVYLGKVWA
jgi:hypothetical protein